MNEKLRELQFEIDDVHGGLLLAIEGFEALKSQINWTNDDIQKFHDLPLDKFHQHAMAQSHDLKIHMTNITNLINYLYPQLIEAKEKLGEANNLAGEIAHKKSPQTECNQSKA